MRSKYHRNAVATQTPLGTLQRSPNLPDGFGRRFVAVMGKQEGRVGKDKERHGKRKEGLERGIERMTKEAVPP